MVDRARNALGARVSFFTVRFSMRTVQRSIRGVGADGFIQRLGYPWDFRRATDLMLLTNAEIPCKLKLSVLAFYNPWVSSDQQTN